MQLAGVRAKVRELLQGDVAAGKRCRQMASALYGDGVQLHLLVGLSFAACSSAALQTRLQRRLVAVFTSEGGGSTNGTAPARLTQRHAPRRVFPFFMNGSKVLRLTSSPTHHNTLK